MDGAEDMNMSASPGLSDMHIMPGSSSASVTPTTAPKKKSRRGGDSSMNQKRRCISTACIACRRRKSKCDGALPSCAACASVYGTECIYNPNSDHRRKGVYREKVDSMKAQASTLQILIEAILNAEEEEVPDIVKKIRTCDSLDAVAQDILKHGTELGILNHDQADDDIFPDLDVDGERELAGKMGELRLENGSVRYIGGTSHLIYLGDPHNGYGTDALPEQLIPGENPITAWTRVTTDSHLTLHLINMYFNYHFPYFTTLSKKLFWRDFMAGPVRLRSGSTAYCSSLLVNTMLALGCHFTDIPGAYASPGDSRTKGDHFFAEAKRLIIENDEYEKPRLVTVQALALMSVREAGCAREAKGWVYSGMSFRMALDIGLNLDVTGLDKEHLSDEEVDARRITFWGCFLFDKCWSNYLGRLPQIPKNSFNVSSIDVFPDEDSAMWAPFTDKGFDETLAQPCRTRAVALELFKLCEISSDLLIFFYHPRQVKRSISKAVELKKLGELHQRLEEWRRDLPKEFEPKEGQLPNVILIHMFFHLQYIHLFRPFLKYKPNASPLPSHISPRRICTSNAGAISKLMRLYKKTWNLRQICNIAVYMIHSACTIHLLNLPEKTAKRDITHGLKHLEEIAEDWPCARRTLSILSVLARKWRCELPEDATLVLQRTDEKYEYYSTSDVPSPRSTTTATTSPLHSEDGAPSANRQDYGQPNQPSPAHLTQPVLQTSIGERISMNGPLPAMTGTNILQTRPVIESVASSNVPFTNGMMGGWNQHLPMSIPSSSQRLSSVNRNGLNSDHLSQTDMRNGSPAQGVNIDSRDWMLSDSARLQQSFESWDMRQPMAGGSVFMFGSNRDEGVNHIQSGNNEQMNAFEGLGASLTSLSRGGWLPANLD